MKSISILNHVIGPVMRGPSSSHTAGSHRLGRLGRSLLGAEPVEAILAFDTQGSYAVTYAGQGADRAFVLGLRGVPLTDASFFTALSDAPRGGLAVRFVIEPLEHPDHPNTVVMRLKAGDGQSVVVEGRSVGGGDVEITWVNDWPVCFDGTAWGLIVEAPPADAGRIATMVRSAEGTHRTDVLTHECGHAAVIATLRRPPSDALIAALRTAAPGVIVRHLEPVCLPHTGEALWHDAAGLLTQATQHRWRLSDAGLAYESALLGYDHPAILADTTERLGIMIAAVSEGLVPTQPGLRLLAPAAHSVMAAAGRGIFGDADPHLRAAARALAVMHVDASMGVVCAAPTGGAAGVIPGALLTLAESRHLSTEACARALVAAGAVGAIIAMRATFAAEVAGCQVEIGAATSMAAAAVVDAAGGSPAQACDAAAVALQNAMGLVCDPVQGLVEIPCHTRNAVAASQALVTAGLILGGYTNPIPLDDTIDAVMAVGRSMSPDLRCTARGGLAVTPAALRLVATPPRA